MWNSVGRNWKFRQPEIKKIFGGTKNTSAAYLNYQLHFFRTNGPVSFGPLAKVVTPCLRLVTFNNSSSQDLQVCCLGYHQHELQVSQSRWLWLCSALHLLSVSELRLVHILPISKTSVRQSSRVFSDGTLFDYSFSHVSKARKTYLWKH